MKIENPVDLRQLTKTFNRHESAAGLFAYEGESRLTAKEGLNALRSRLPGLQEAWVFVGSEGGFSESEVQLFRELGISTTTLGSQVLRVETACLALISIIKYDLDLMR